MKIKITFFTLLITIVASVSYALVVPIRQNSISTYHTTEKQPKTTKDSTTLRFPIQSKTINDYEDLYKKYPIDLKDPKNLTTDINYDIPTGNYIVSTKVGDFDIHTPLVLTPKEYSRYRLDKSMQNYWQEKNTSGINDNENKFSITDMKFSLGPADKLFGPGGVQVKMQGSTELIFGFKSNFINNPSIPERARRSNIPEFDQKIQVNIKGSVGDKINFGMNYNTGSQFDFDKKLLKLSFKGKEDDIIQLIEAGNVSMPLQSSLITGSTALFGIRTDLQFGKLNISAIASQQESESKTVSTRGGAQTTPFEIKIDQYDNNRHFFLNHHFRENYEDAMKQLPVISSGITINRVEVWITNKRGQFDQSRNIIAFMDLGEPKRIDKAHWQPTATKQPSNQANSLYQEISNIPNVRNIQQSNAILSQQYTTLGINGGEDYEKIENARRLNPTEYTINNSLGFISLRRTLNPDEVLAVAYEYNYGGQTYQVGEFSTDNIKAPQALLLKLLKGTTQSPQLSSWDLMMKNIYSIGAMQMSSEDFQLDIVYRNDSIGTELQYISEGNIANQRLLQVMNLDRLDSKNATNPDGKFDYIEGYTALSASGRIIFPVLEPFGNYLKERIGNPTIAQKYIYQELYDSTLVVAQEFSEKNKFTLAGRYKGSSGGSEIRLNAMNIPRGSVKVTAGGATLVENVDYTVDYMMGSVTILNQSILESNTNVDVKLENQATFNTQRKSLFGTHIDYNFSKNLNIGGTIMHLSEMPLTKKVNTGNEPIKNTIFGFNLAWRKESQWLTNLIDKLPFVNATQPSSIALNAEYAQLIPGHSKIISETGLAYIDDFESTQTHIDIHYPYNWYLSSTPYNPNPTGLFPEAAYSNDIRYGENRALLAWYNVDQVLNGKSRRTPANLRGNLESQSNHYTRAVAETELFPNRDINPTRLSTMTLLNLSYYPTQRGPYNLDIVGMNPDGTLANPTKRWGGIMRKIETSDFETANIEYFEFWMLDPFIYNDGKQKGGDLYFNLGDISEDILKDGKKSFENGLPIDDNTNNTETTVWGRVPKTQSTVSAFDNTPGARIKQDVGLNGLSTQDEFLFPTYQNYIKKLRQKLNPTTISQMEKDPHSPLNDPAGDNYRFYLNEEFDKTDASILERYKYYNGTEGNSPDAANTASQYSESATLTPDMEDINADNTLNEYEKYYQYHISLRPQDMQVGKNKINDIVTTEVYLKNGKTETVKWYQFKIPIREYDEKIGSIRNFKSIRFIRMFLTGFEQTTHLRFATLNLVRGEWKPYTKPLEKISTASNGRLDILAVNIEENGRKSPVNYVLPPGITRETDPGQPQLLQNNEQAMVLRATNLEPGEAKGVYKNTNYDMRQYKRFQMFVHAEKMLENNPQAQSLQDGELSCFVRIGSDMLNNYYEYEIPLILTAEGTYTSDKLSDRQNVWPQENMFDFPYSILTEAKLKRNKERDEGDNNISNTKPYIQYDQNKPKNKITIIGNPTIAKIENIMIGVRNNGNQTKSGEIWVNEMRMSEFDQEGGWAALTNVAINLSDIGSINAAGRIETAGFGGIESNVNNRNMENNYQISLSAALDLGRFLPQQAKLQIPTYYTYSNENSAPKYNPLDQDIILKDAFKALHTKEQIDSLKQKTENNRKTESFNITNAKINIKSKKPMPYDPANIAFTYSISQTEAHTPEIQQNLTKQQKIALTYNYTFGAKPWEPFKNNKALNKPTTKILKDFNIYYLPTSINYSTTLNRTYSQTQLRDFTNTTKQSNIQNTSFSKDFTWNRQFDIQYNLTKSLKFGLQTAMNANIEESYYTPEINKDYYQNWRDTVWNSIKKMGTPYTYQQVFSASWKIPIDKLPYLNFTNANIQYNATYSWNRSQPIEGNIDIGNLASSMGRWAGNTEINLETLYKKSKYLKGIIQRGNTNTKKTFVPQTHLQTYQLKVGDTIIIQHGLGSEKIRFTARDKNGKIIKLQHKIRDAVSVAVYPQENKKNVSINITSEDPNKRTIAQKIADFTFRLPMTIRRISISYNQSSSLTIPGFLPQPKFLGQEKWNTQYAPDWKFVFGIHTPKTLQNAVEQQWLYMGKDIINPANQAQTSDLDIKAVLEPIAGVKINLSARRQTQSNTNIQFMYKGMPSNFTGNFNITQIALKTAFEKIGTIDNNYHSKTFQQFLNNRNIIAARIENQYKKTNYPNNGFFQELPNIAGKPFDPTNGTIDKNAPDVLIPAFLAAYTGQNPQSVKTNPFLSLWEILPNWNISYNGLSQLPWIKNKLKSISLTHGYSSRYTIGNYNSFSTWIPTTENNQMGYIRDIQNSQPIPSMPYDIATVSLNENFSPLIGVNLAMKNSMTAKAEYRKQRNLTLNLTSTQLIEGLSDELVIGVGYLINNFDMILKLKSNKRKTIKNDLKLNLDISYKDIKSLLRKINENITQASSGNKIISIRCTADYVFSSKINLQLFFDRQMTAPLISTSYPVSATNFGISFKFLLSK